MNPSNSLRKNFIWNTIGSTIYAFTSLFFLVIVTRLNSLSNAGIFTFAFSNATLFYIIGTYAGRAYQVTEKDPTLDDNAYFYNRLLSVFAMVLLGSAFGFLRGYDGYKFLIIFLLILYRALDAFSDVLYGIVQKNNRLYQAGISLTLKSLLGTALFLAIDLLTGNLIYASLSLSVASLTVMVFYDFRVVRRVGFRLKSAEWRRSLLIFRLGFFTFLFTFLTQYLINAPKYAIDSSLDSSAQTIYGIISMPATIMALAGSLLVYPFLTRFKGLLKQNAPLALNRLTCKLSAAVVVLGIVAILAGFFFSVPFFQILYGLDTSPYVGNLTIILLGATLYAVTVILSNTLIAMRRTISQSVIFAITALFAFLISTPLVSSSGLLGGALSYLFSMSLLLFLYTIIYVISLKKEKQNATS